MGVLIDQHTHYYWYWISYMYLLLSQMYKTNPMTIAIIDPACTALMLFQPKVWLSTNTMAAMTMMMMPKFFKSPFIIFRYLLYFLVFTYNNLQRNTIFSKCENKFSEKFIFLLFVGIRCVRLVDNVDEIADFYGDGGVR